MFGSILLNDAEARRGLQNIDRQANNTSGRIGAVGRAGSAMGSTIRKYAGMAAAALTTVGGVAAGIKFDAMMEQSQVAWTTLLGSAGKAKNMLQDISNFAKSTPFETADVDMMAKYMHNAGLEGKGLFDALMKVSDVASAFNVPIAEAKEMTRQMSQVRQAGVAYTEDLNILQDRGVPIYKAISKQMGITVADVKKLASQGELTSDIYIKSFNSIADGVKGASDKQSKTFNGMISTIKDNLSIVAGQLAKPFFNKLKSGMDGLMPVLDGLTSLSKGDFKGFAQSVNNAFGPEVGSVIIGFISTINNGVGNIKSALDKGKQALSGIKEIFNGNIGKGVSILNTLGFSDETIQKVISFSNNAKSLISRFFDTIKSLFSGNNAISSSFGKIFETAKSIVMPILEDIVSFVGQKIAMIKQFWDENGAQITQAVKNAWDVIAAIFKFISPVILFIVGMLWDSVKGVINGALNIIMGMIKIFAGLFTGDWSKMWEGIKQLFSGAIEFIWNLINLMMFGRILGGIKAFFANSTGIFRNLWTTVVGYFKGLQTNALGIFRDLFTGARSQFNNIFNTARSIFNSIKSAITSPIETAKNLIIGFISKIKSAFANMGIKIPLPHFKTSNFSLNPADWVKHGLPKISVDWYAKGTNFAPGGYAVVGEQGPELMYVPRGSKINTANETKKIMNNQAQPPKQPAIIQIVTPDKREMARWLVDDLTEFQEFKTARLDQF